MLLQFHKISMDDSNRIQLISIISFEIILLAFEFLAFFGTMISMTGYQFHFNLKMIFGYGVVAYWLDIIARSVIICFEVGVFDLDDDIISSESDKLPWNYSNKLFIILLCCSLYRVHFMMLICSLTLLLAIERYFATIWVSTYESKKHKWISFLLVGSNILVGGIGSLIFHYELLLNMILAISLGLCLNLVSIVFFITLYSLNKTQMEYCQTRDILQSYTLSLRFQLNENLKTMKWLKNTILVVTCFNTMLAGFLVVSNHEYLKKNSPVLVKYCHAFLNLGIAVYAQVTFFVIILADRNYRSYFLRFKVIRYFTKPFFGRIFPEDFRIKKTLSTNEPFSEFSASSNPSNP
ncbi:CBN-SRE-2 protein [Caenorhabditis brenneri]|uniref:CBN-SRE-2 protein n=1 Tax=Caenorhabditis brenneri TaxID=135651 RepID=G0NY81_CAEBE|nr:CBN-SRE-2 protein [Caenorhabditis brenneri]